MKNHKVKLEYGPKLQKWRFEFKNLQQSSQQVQNTKWLEEMVLGANFWNFQVYLYVLSKLKLQTILYLFKIANLLPILNTLIRYLLIGLIAYIHLILTHLNKL